MIMDKSFKMSHSKLINQISTFFFKDLRSFNQDSFKHPKMEGPGVLHKRTVFTNPLSYYRA